MFFLLKLLLCQARRILFQLRLVFPLHVNSFYLYTYTGDFCAMEKLRDKGCQVHVIVK